MNFQDVKAATNSIEIKKKREEKDDSKMHTFYILGQAHFHFVELFGVYKTKRRMESI
jgi:hypothetical protein